MGGLGLLLGRAAFVGDAGPDATAVVVADAAAGEARVLQPLHQARERALAEVDLLGELLHAHVALGCGGEVAQHLVLAQRQLVLPLQGALERLPDNRMGRLQLAPPLK